MLRERGNDLLERRVARALAESVDGALHLARAGSNGGQRVRGREPEVVVAMSRNVNAGTRSHDLADERSVFGRDRVADGIGDVQDSRAPADCRQAHLHDERRVGP